MSYTEDYDKSAPVNVEKLNLEIIAETGITKTLEDKTKYNEDETPTNLHITFNLEPDAGEKILLNAVVTNHDGNPATTYPYFCYCCGLNYSEASLSTPTQCQVCSSTDIQEQYHKCNLIATINPTVDNDITEGYCVGSPWINKSTNDIFQATDVTEGAAVWNKMLKQVDVSLTGVEPADSDVSGWSDGDRGHGIGTGDREFYMVKRGSVVMYVEMAGVPE